MTSTVDRRTGTDAGRSGGADGTGGRPGGVRSGTGSAWQLVTRREIVVKATDRSFLVGTVVTVAIIAAVMVLQIFLANRTSTYDVAVTTSDRATADAVRTAAPRIDENVKVVVRPVADDTAARAAVEAETADAWLHRDGGGWVLTTRSEPKDDLRAVVEQVVREEALKANAAAAGTTVDALERGSALTTTFLDGDAQRATLVAIVSFAFTFLFYMATLMFGVTLANSVVEEKQSRVVEIIATAIPLRHLLAGKVLGNTALAVLQMLLFLGVGMTGLAFTEYSSLVTAVSGPVAWFVVFFLAGFVSLACLWAVAGSLASRTEDLQSTTTPLNMVVLAIFFAALVLQGTPQAVASYIPPVSAVVMPVRLLQGDASWPEALAALALLVVAAAATVLVGERLYRRSLLQSGGRIGLRQAWRTQE